jgi:3-hydroxyacyl-[acyl-carrier-protein] dehydratase
MLPKDLIIDFSQYDTRNVIADRAEIRKYNLQRHEMEQIDAVVYENPDRCICVGYKDVTMNEFWVSGDVRGTPVMPALVICEAAAQLSSYFTVKFDLLGADILGLGGVTGLRHYRQVVPGERLVIAVEQVKVRRGAMIVCRFQCFVDRELVMRGQIKGVPLSRP